MAEELPTKIIVSGTNGELLHEDPASKHDMINSDVQTEGEVNSNEANGSPGGTPVDSEPVSKPKLTPEEYLEKHKINVLFEELIYRTLDSTPENPLKFLLSNLETMEKDNWVPGDSQEEKTNAVTKVFKLPEPKNPDPPKGTGVGGRTGTGAGRGAAPKVGTVTTKPAPRTTATRPGPASKTASSPPKTTSRVTTTKPVVKTTGTPIKPPPTGSTRTPAAGTGRATTAPVKPVASSPGTATKTGTGAARTGTTSATRPATTGAVKTTTATPRRPTTTTSATNKTGSNTSVSKTGATKTTTTPRSTARQPSGPAKSTTAPKTGAGGRVNTTKQPLGRGGKPAATPGKNTGGVGAKQEVVPPPAPEPEPQTPVEEPEPEPAEPEPEPKPKTPEPDGAWSQIPGSDESEAKPLDLEDQLAHDDLVHLSDDENIIEVVEKKDSDDQSNPSEEVPEVAEPVEKPADSFMTSHDYAADLQSIENEADQANQGDKLEDLIDEGIEMREDFVRTSIPTIPPGMSQILGAYKSVKAEDTADAAPSDTQNIVEVVVAETEPPKELEDPIDAQEPIEPQGNIEIVVEKQTEELPELQGNIEIVVEKQTEELLEPQGNIEIVVEKQTEESHTEPQGTTETDLVDTSEPVATSEPTLEEPLLQTADDPGVDVNDPSPPPLQQDPVPITEEATPIAVGYEESSPPQLPDLLSGEPEVVYQAKPDTTTEDTSQVTDPVDPPSPDENPNIDTNEPPTQTQPEVQPELPQVPSPDPQEELIQIEPIFPPASTGDDN